jgi:phosphatidate phosphatase
MSTEKMSPNMEIYQRNHAVNQRVVHPNTEEPSPAMFRRQAQNDYDTETIEREPQLKKRIVQTVIDVIVIIIIFIAFILVYALVDPKILYFTCDQSDIFMPLKPDTVPFWAVPIYSVLGPLIFIILVEILNSKLFPGQPNKRNLSLRSRGRQLLICAGHSISLFVLGIAITLLLTEIGKRWVGRLRPHFIAVCNPDFSKVNCISSAGSGNIYNAIDTGGSFCRGDEKDVKEARLSFPSGHSSFSWYCMVFLIVYLEARLILTRFRFMKPLIQMVAFIAAFVTMLSRVSDYHHRGSDVIGGTVLGNILSKNLIIEFNIINSCIYLKV